MSARLTPIPFTRDDLDAVADFECGATEWARYVADWIKDGPVIEALNNGTQVWLYIDDDNRIVGYGSLGTTEWLYPDPYGQQPGSERVQLCVIPAYAVQTEYQRKPEGDWREHYSSEILSDLMNEAVLMCRQNPSLEHLLGLFVHPLNTRAIQHYENHGFIKYGKVIKTRGQRMLLNLPMEEAGQSQPPSFEEAVSSVLNAPPTPEQQAKKAARKARAEERKKLKQPKHRH